LTPYATSASRSVIGGAAFTFRVASDVSIRLNEVQRTRCRRERSYGNIAPGTLRGLPGHGKESKIHIF
jgi:hypothetical protein